jgi:hypothetical protein
MNKVVPLICAALLPATLVVAAPAQAKPIAACVKKSNGSLKILKKKAGKCKKGWKRIEWNSQGPSGANGSDGAQGASGPSWLVKDAADVTLGTFAGFTSEPFQSGANPIQAPTLATLIYVLGADGGIFRYYMDGSPYVDGIWFRDNGCTDAVLFNTEPNNLKIYLRAAGSSARAVHWVTGAPVATGWRVPASSTSAFSVNVSTLFLKSTVNGVCSPSGINANGYGVQLAPAPAPIVGTGPVRIVR